MNDGDILYWDEETSTMEFYNPSRDEYRSPELFIKQWEKRQLAEVATHYEWFDMETMPIMHISSRSYSVDVEYYINNEQPTQRYKPNYYIDHNARIKPANKNSYKSQKAQQYLKRKYD